MLNPQECYPRTCETTTRRTSHDVGPPFFSLAIHLHWFMVQYRSQRKWRGWIKGRGPSPNVSEVLAAEVEYEKRTRVSCRGKQAKAGGGVGAEHICFFFFLSSHFIASVNNSNIVAWVSRTSSYDMRWTTVVCQSKYSRGEPRGGCTWCPDARRRDRASGLMSLGKILTVRMVKP